MPHSCETRRPQYPAHPAFLLVTGTLGLLGIVSLTAGQVAGALLLPDYDWTAQTISDLAAGRNEIVMDIGLYGFAAALTAAALGAAHLHLGRAGWTLGTFALVLLAAATIIIGARNEYGDGDQEGVVIHGYVVVAIGILFAGLPFLMMGGARLAGKVYARIFLACGVLWSVGAPLFFVVPSGWDGAWERALGLVACAFLAVLSLLFINVARQSGPSPGAHAARQRRDVAVREEA